MVSTDGWDIKIKRERKCLNCYKEKATLNWHKLTKDGVIVISYMCRCGEETIIRRSIKWV